MRYILTLFVSVFIHLVCFSQTGDNPQAENGSVFLIRSTGFNGSASAYPVFIDEILACRVENDSYTVHLIAPGVHKVAVQFSGKTQKKNAETLNVTIEAGKKYFIQLTVQGGLLTNKIYCQEITENSAQQLFKRIREGNCK